MKLVSVRVQVCEIQLKLLGWEIIGRARLTGVYSGMGLDFYVWRGCTNSLFTSGYLATEYLLDQGHFESLPYHEHYQYLLGVQNV